MYILLYYLSNSEVLEFPIIAKIDEEDFIYVNGETNDTVWPG